MKHADRNDEHVENAVWPLGKSAYPVAAPKGKLVDLNGKTIGELWNRVFRGEEIFPIVRAELKARFPGICIVDYSHFGPTHGAGQDKALAEMPKLFAQHGVDAVISGIGA
jgi:hypothetical protein